MRLGLALVLLATLSSCWRSSDREAPISAEQLDPILQTLEFAGCAELRAGTTCELDPSSELVFWIRDPTPAVLSLESGGKMVTASKARVGGGLQIKPGKLSDELIVRLTLGSASKSWKLSLRPHQPPPLLTEINSLRKNGQSARAEELLEQRASELERGLVLGLKARLALAKGELTAADQLFVQAAELDCGGATPLRCASLLFARSYLLTTNLRNFEAAEDTLNRAATIARTAPQIRTNLALYRALLAKYRADPREALVWSAEVDRAAKRLDQTKLAWLQRQTVAELLSWIGQEAAAFAVLEALIAEPPEDITPCEQADVLTNMGWNRLLARESGAAELDVRGPLEAAMKLHETSCDRPLRASNVATNLALAAIQEGDTKNARSWLNRAQSAIAAPSLELRLWWDDIEGRIALSERRLKKASEIYRRLHQLATSAASAGAKHRASLGEASAARAAGDSNAAIAAYRRAEQELEALALRVPVSLGRDTFLADREESARALVTLLLERDRVSEAFELARQARRRSIARIAALRSIERLTPEQRRRWNAAIADYQTAREKVAASASSEWELSADQLSSARENRAALQAEMQRSLETALALIEGTSSGLPPIAPGELLLTYFPLEKSNWVSFAAAQGNISFTRISSSAPALEAFDSAIERAEKIRVLSYGPMRAVDIHTLPWRGQPLIASRPVYYSLDLAPATTSSQSGALIVADASENLPAAISEGREIEKILTAKQLEVSLLTGASATHKTVRSALERAKLFHYAGHGLFAGVSGFDSALGLSDGPFSVADVLSLRSVPSEIVLAGCETTRSSVAGAESWGLAQAFVLAGAEVVVGAARPVPDRLARRFSELYHGAAGDPGQRFRAATSQIAKEGENLGLFRLISP